MTPEPGAVHNEKADLLRRINLNCSPIALDRSTKLGHAMTVLTGSASSRCYPIASVVAFLGPPIALDQIKFFFDRRGEPFGFVTWAYFDQETELEMLQEQRVLHISEYRGGDNLWLTEIYCPISASNVIKSYLREIFSSERCVFFAHRDAMGVADAIHRWKEVEGGLRKSRILLKGNNKKTEIARFLDP